MRRLCGWLAAVLALLGAAPAAAHNLPYSLVTGQVTADGRYHLRLECDVAALIMGLPQQHLTPEQQQAFAALSDAEVQARVAVMAAYLRQTISIEADGRRVATPAPVFPSLADIRADSRMTLASAAPSAPIMIDGVLPAGASTVQLSFPTVLASVVLIVKTPTPGEPLQGLVPGERSHPLRLRDAAAAGLAVPGWLVTGLQYIRIGAAHILSGPDHLLFVLGLLLIVQDRWMLIKTVSAFTVAHSITLAVATLWNVTLPTALLDTLIALSILALGPEAIRAKLGQSSLTIRHPWVVAFAFGLLHGFGFATGLTSMGVPRPDIPLALCLFNVGVEVGQLGFVFLILGLERAFRLMEISWPTPVRWAPASLVMFFGAWWTVQYASALF